MGTGFPSKAQSCDYCGLESQKDLNMFVDNRGTEI